MVINVVFFLAYPYRSHRQWVKLKHILNERTIFPKQIVLRNTHFMNFENFSFLWKSPNSGALVKGDNFASCYRQIK